MNREDQKHLISVIIPVYNVAAFLGQCVTFTLNQTYENIEVILVDDGSTDACHDICDRYGRKDARVRVIHKPNGGLSDARNAGIDIAKGDYIIFIDSDDYMEPDAIEYLYSLIIENDADISVCQMRRVAEDGSFLKSNEVFCDRTVEGTQNALVAYFEGNDIRSVAWGKLYKRELFATLRFPVGKYNEDEFTTYRAIAESQRIAIGKEKKYHYRMRATSIMNSSFSEKHLDCIEAALERIEFMEKSFPDLVPYARAHVIHATNQCLLRFAKAKNISMDAKQLKKRFSSYYKTYGKDFRKCERTFALRCLSLLASFSIGLTVRVLRIKK